MTARQAIAQAPVPGAPGPSATPFVDAIRRGLGGRLTRNTTVLQPAPAKKFNLDAMNKAQLINLLRANELPGNASETKETLISRFKTSGLVD
jgi:hypothetical protein